MSEWKLPLKVKIYEALSAVVDGRVRLIGPGLAEVASSGGDKVYKVSWNGQEITSSDPSSRFHGTLGYPAVAVLMATGRLAFEPEIAEPLRGVPWKTLNDRFNRDYEAAVRHVLAEGATSSARLESMVDRIFAELGELHLMRPAGKAKPGSSGPS
jgi:hypothetical protein